MKKCRILMTGSWKGGVGKSTIAANLALSLALIGKRVLVCDCDFKMRCLDLVMGHHDNMVFNMVDVMYGKVNLLRAAVKDTRAPNLWFCGAPARDVEIDARSFRVFVARAADELNADYIILDTAGSISDSFDLAASVSDTAIIVASHNPTSIRAAESTAEQLHNKNVTPLLIVNNFDTLNISSYQTGERNGIIDIIEQTSIKLLGVIPFSYGLAVAQEKGQLFDSVGGDVSHAFRNIAMRLEGETIPLFKGFRSQRKVKKTY